MYGHEGVTRDLKRRLEQRLPVVLNTIRLDRSATLRALPNPVRVYPHFMPDIDVDGYPSLCITELDTPTGLTGARAVRQGIQADSYVYNYPFRIWFYVMASEYGEVELQLKRYMTAVRMVILENRVLTHNAEAHVTFDPETLSENFDQSAEDENRMILGAGFVGVVLESTEVINRLGRDPRMDLPLHIDGGVQVTDLFTDGPAGAPSTFGGVSA